MFTFDYTIMNRIANFLNISVEEYEELLRESRFLQEIEDKFKFVKDEDPIPIEIANQLMQFKENNKSLFF